MTDVTAKPVMKKSDSNAPKNIILSDKELEEKEDKLENKNTLKRERSAHIALHRFLEQAGVENTDYWLYSDEDLCHWL